MTNKNLFLYLLILLTLSANKISAQRIVQVTDGYFYENASSKSFYFFDETDSLSIEEIKTYGIQREFEPYYDNVLNFGYSSKTVWIKLEVQNNTNQVAILESDILRYQLLEFYKVRESGEFISQRFHGGMTFYERNINTTYHTFSIDPFSRQTCYLKLKSRNNVLFSLRIFSYQAYIHYTHQKSIFNGLYYGFVALISLFVISIYFLFKEKIYLYYLFSVLGSCLVIMNISGQSFELLWPSLPFLNNFMPALNCISLLCILWFSINFLNINQLDRIWRQCAGAVALGMFFCMVLNIVDFGYYSTRISQLLILLHVVFVIALSYQSYRMGFRSARFFILAWGVYLLSALLTILFVNQLIENTPEIFDWLTIGSGIEITLLSLAMADKIKAERVQKAILESQNIYLLEENARILEEQNEFLTMSIDDRTRQINRQNQILLKSQSKLTKVNQELKQKQEEILAQNEELLQSQGELESQRAKLIEQNHIIEIQNYKLKHISENLEKLAGEKTQQLLQANLELINHNHQLEQFAFITAHNLRSPVARLLGLVNILSYNEHTSDADKEVIQFIRQSAKDMDEVMRDLNDILEIKKGSNHSFDKLNLYDKLSEASKLLESEIKEHAVQIQTDFSQCEEIFAINAYLKSILYNLLSNAIKYRSPKRELFVYIYTTVLEEEICLVFQDNGLGIDLKNFGEQIFGLYKRFHNHKEGKGLGLYLVKTQIEAMKGRIEIKSELDRGTSFYLYFRK